LIKRTFRVVKRVVRACPREGKRSLRLLDALSRISGVRTTASTATEYLKGGDLSIFQSERALSACSEWSLMTAFSSALKGIRAWTSS
jgi:hypothetical protein